MSSAELTGLQDLRPLTYHAAQADFKTARLRAEQKKYEFLVTGDVKDAAQFLAIERKDYTKIFFTTDRATLRVGKSKKNWRKISTQRIIIVLYTI